MSKNNKGLIIFLITTIVILLTLVILLSTGTIEFKNNNEQIIEFIHTDLPLPVAPAIKMCGILPTDNTTDSLSQEQPRQVRSVRSYSLNASVNIHSCIVTVFRLTVGISKAKSPLQLGICFTLECTLADTTVGGFFNCVICNTLLSLK